jgi:uncharacterized protein
MLKLVASAQQRKFGDDKRDSLTGQCRRCPVRQLCNGGCPKDRFAVSRDGEPGQNYLCPGLELFFTHTRPAMLTMARLLQSGRRASEVMALTSAGDAKRGPYEPCPCGSGQKFRFCHGNRSPRSSFSGVSPATAVPRDRRANTSRSEVPSQPSTGGSHGTAT